MDLTQGALWGFRLFLFRDPRDDAELDGMARGATGAEELRARFIALPLRVAGRRSTPSKAVVFALAI